MIVRIYWSIFIASPIVLWWSRQAAMKQHEAQPETSVAAH